MRVPFPWPPESYVPPTTPISTLVLVQDRTNTEKTATTREPPQQ